MTFNGSVEDRLAIRELIDSYGDAVMRRDAEAWIANWADDAVWAIRGREIKGKPDIKAAWLTAMANYKRVGFFGAPGSMKVDGDRATLQVHTLEFLVPVDGEPRRQLGFYEDQLVRSGGRWLYARRTFTPFAD
jgi:uncharacterized protein (TIGR02246 family)